MPNLSVYGVVIVAALLIGGFFVFGSGGFQFVIKGSEDKPTFILNPKFGTFYCKAEQVEDVKLPSQETDPFDFFGQKYLTFSTGCPSNTPSCLIGAELRCDGFLCGSSSSIVEWRVRGLNSNDFSDWKQEKVSHSSSGTSKSIFFERAPGNNQFISGDTIEIRTIKSALGAEITMFGLKKYQAYALYQESPESEDELINSQGCTIVGVKQLNGDDIYPERCVKDCEEAGNYNSGTERLDFTGPKSVQNYLGGYSLGPVEDVLNYNGQEAYCSGSQPAILRSFKTFETNYQFYNVPGDKIGEEQCCPGQRLGGQICGEDFKFSIEQGETGDQCTIFGTVDSCEGAGRWVVDSTDPARQTLIRATGCDSNNSCEYETANVECTSSSQCTNPVRPICSVNYVCVTEDEGPDPFTPTCGDNVCAPGEQESCPQDCRTLPTCGNNICEVGENPSNCLDCVTDQPIDFNFIILLVVALGIIGIIGIGIVKAFRGRK